MRIRVIVLASAVLLGCGGGQQQVSVSQQTIRELGEFVGPCVATVDSFLDLLVGLLNGSACIDDEFDSPPDPRSPDDPPRIQGRDDPRGPDRPDTAPRPPDAWPPSFRCSEPEFDPETGETTWRLTSLAVVLGDTPRDGVASDLEISVRFELGGVPITLFDPRDPPKSVDDLFEGYPNGTTMYLEWTFLDGSGSGSLTAVFQDGAISEVSGGGLFAGLSCGIEFTFDELDPLPRKPYPSAEITIEVEINGETVTVTVSLDGTEVASCVVTVGGETADCVLDLAMGSLSQPVAR